MAKRAGEITSVDAMYAMAVRFHHFNTIPPDSFIATLNRVLINKTTLLITAVKRRDEKQVNAILHVFKNTNFIKTQVNPFAMCYNALHYACDQVSAGVLGSLLADEHVVSMIRGRTIAIPVHAAIEKSNSSALMVLLRVVNYFTDNQIKDICKASFILEDEFFRLFIGNERCKNIAREFCFADDSFILSSNSERYNEVFFSLLNKLSEVKPVVDLRYNILNQVTDKEKVSYYLPRNLITLSACDAILHYLLISHRGDFFSSKYFTFREVALSDIQAIDDGEKQKLVVSILRSFHFNKTMGLNQKFESHKPIVRMFASLAQFSEVVHIIDNWEKSYHDINNAWIKNGGKKFNKVERVLGFFSVKNAAALNEHFMKNHSSAFHK